MRSWFLSVFNAIVAWVNLVVELDQDSEQQDFDFEEFLGCIAQISLMQLMGSGVSPAPL